MANVDITMLVRSNEKAWYKFQDVGPSMKTCNVDKIAADYYICVDTKSGFFKIVVRKKN